MKIGETFQEARDWSGNMVLGTLVIGLYIFFVLSVFTGFASYIIRTDWEARLNGSESAAEIVELDALFFIVSRERELKSEIELLRPDLQIVDEQIDAAKQRLFEIEARRKEVTVVVEQAAREILLFLRGIEVHLSPESAAALRAESDLGLIERAERIVSAYPDAEFRPDVTEDRLAEINDRFIAVSARFGERNGELARLALERSEAEDDRDRRLGARSWPQRKLEGAETELRQLQERIPLQSLLRAQEAELAKLFLGIPRYLVSYPTIFLTLFATIAAGGLGAVVSFSRSFFSATATATAARLFVSVGEGIAAAIAVFLFSGAGMLVLTQGGGAASQIELSPYTVAFVAFVSGFMAEDAFSSIQAAGRRIFSANGDGRNGKAAEKVSGANGGPGESGSTTGPGPPPDPQR